MNKKSAVMGVIAVALIGGFTAVSVGLSLLGVSLYRLEVAPPRTITVVGTAEATNTNQVASFNANVSEVGDSKEAVNQLMREKVDSLIQSAKDFGISEANIQTQYFNIYQEQSTNYDSPDLVVRTGPWRGTTTVNFSLIPAGQTTDFSQLLISSGATSIDGPSFGIDDISSFQDQLASDAITKAREKAEEIAQGQGLSVGKVLMIDETNTGAGYMPFYSSRDMGGGGGGFAPGSTEISKSVMVTFELR